MVKKRVLFVCLGNICRSPLAEAIFTQEINSQGRQHEFEVDSCGTNGFHNGEKADPRTRANAKLHGVDVTSISRQLTVGDLQDFDHIITMARDVYNGVLPYAKDAEIKSKLECWEVPDPWYGGEDGFEDVFHIIDKKVKLLLEKL